MEADIWGGDPWADNAKTGNQEKKELQGVKRPGLLAGFEDEAGWGSFEESVGDGGEESSWGSGEKFDVSKLEEKLQVDAKLGLSASFAPTIISPGWESGETVEATDLKEWKADTEPKLRPSISPAITSPGWESVPPISASLEILAEPQHQSQILSLHSPPAGQRTEEVSNLAQESTDLSKIVPEDSEPSVFRQHTGPKLSESPPSLSDSSGKENEGIPPSLSSSEGSNVDEGKTSDSLRTSFDESYSEAEHWDKRHSAGEAIAPLALVKENTNLQDDDFGDSEDEAENEAQDISVQATADSFVQAENELNLVPENVQLKGKQDATLDLTRHPVCSTAGPHFDYDLSLINKLFKNPGAPRSYPDPTADVVASSSTRKTWYRITRPQTLRQINEGSTDDNYVRVAWPRSEIRDDVLKIVSRWASEDKTHGRIMLGERHPAGTTFGWDESAPARLGNYPRRRGIGIESPATKDIGNQNPVGLVSGMNTRRNESLMPNTGEEESAVAQFSWSSSATKGAPPSQEVLPGKLEPVGSLFGLAAPPSATSNSERTQMQVHKRDSRSVSVSVNPELPSSAATHRRSATTGDAHIGIPGFDLFNRTEAVKPFWVPEVIEPLDMILSPKGQVLSPLKLDPAETTLQSNLEAGDEDEWGEMMKSPVSPHTPTTAVPTISDGRVADSPSAVFDSAIRRPRKPPPFLPALPKQATFVPGLLSPARKAAFDAARVTRTLSSQQVESPSSAEELVVDAVDQPQEPPPVFSIPDEGWAATSDVVERPISTESFTALHSSPNVASPPPLEHQSPPSKDPMLHTDFSMFDTTPELPPARAPTSTQVPKGTVIPLQSIRDGTVATTEETEEAQRILRKIPDLSYMLR